MQRQHSACRFFPLYAGGTPTVEMQYHSVIFSGGQNSLFGRQHGSISPSLQHHQHLSHGNMKEACSMLRSFDAETHCQARANNAFFRELIPSTSCFLNDSAMEAVNRMVPSEDVEVLRLRTISNRRTNGFKFPADTLRYLNEYSCASLQLVSL